MNINGTPYRTIWLGNNGWSVAIIDQTRLPHELAILRARVRWREAAHAIRSMQVRGAPLIGATAAYGVCLALRADPSDEALDAGASRCWPSAADRRQPALGAGARCAARCATCRAAQRVPPPMPRAAAICDEDVATNRAIGEHGARADPRGAAQARSRASRSTC